MTTITAEFLDQIAALIKELSAAQAEARRLREWIEERFIQKTRRGDGTPYTYCVQCHDGCDSAEFQHHPDCKVGVVLNQDPKP